MFEKKCKLKGIKGKDDKQHLVANSRAMLPAQILDELIKHMEITCIKYLDQ